MVVVALAGAAVTFAGSAVLWFRDETRRIRRGLKHVLKAEPEVLLVANGRGRGVGFSFATGLAAVAWDSGGWCLVYNIDELMGAGGPFAELAKALESGKLSGAILDVFDPEPLPASSPLWKAPNLIITPHCSSDDLDHYLPLTLDLAFANVVRLRDGKRLKNAVDPATGY